MIEPIAAPEQWTVLLARPPFTLESERALLERHGISHVVSKNAGGAQTFAKIVAAREKNLPVIMVQRPLKPAARSFADAAAVARAVAGVISP